MDDIEAIKKLKVRYCRTLDTKDRASYRQTFTEDLPVDTTAAGGARWEGAEVFVAAMKDILGELVTVHQGHMPEIDLTSPASATGIWDLEDVVQFQDGLEMHGYDYCHETYRKVGGAWKISSFNLTRLRTDMIPAGAGGARVAPPASLSAQAQATSSAQPPANSDAPAPGSSSGAASASSPRGGTLSPQATVADWLDDPVGGPQLTFDGGWSVQ